MIVGSKFRIYGNKIETPRKIKDKIVDTSNVIFKEKYSKPCSLFFSFFLINSGISLFAVMAKPNVPKPDRSVIICKETATIP